MKARTTGYAVALLMAALIAGSAVAHPTGGYGGGTGHGMMGHGMMGSAMMGTGEATGEDRALTGQDDASDNAKDVENS